MLVFLKIFLATIFPLSTLTEQDQFLKNFQQNDYKQNVERIELVRFNKDYVEEIKLATFKYNRTCTAFNVSVTFKVDMGNEMEVVFQTYRFASNEYRLFPLRFEVNFCDALSKNILGIAGHTKCGNFSGCPIMKGKRLHMCNFTPDSSNFPPLIPSGKYMWQLQTLYRSVEVYVGNAYSEITRPFTGK